MEDLASIVLDQLQLKDGPAPFSLLYRQAPNHINDQAGATLVVAAARINATIVYELSYAIEVLPLRERGTGKKHGISPSPMRWKRVSYSDSRAAASFAMSFILRNDHLQERVHTFRTFEAVDLAVLFGECSDGGGPVFGKHWIRISLDTGCEYHHFPNGLDEKAIGVRTLQCESQLRNALVSLMPLSVQLR